MPRTAGGDLAGQRRGVADIAAEACGADQGAIPAGQTPIRNLLPSGCSRLRAKAKAAPRSASLAYGSDSRLQHLAAGVKVGDGGDHRGEMRQDLGPSLRPDTNDVAQVVTLTDLAQGQVEPGVGSGPVPIEVQKQVAAGVPHSAVTMKAPSRLAV